MVVVVGGGVLLDGKLAAGMGVVVRGPHLWYSNKGSRPRAPVYMYFVKCCKFGMPGGGGVKVGSRRSTATGDQG